MSLDRYVYRINEGLLDYEFYSIGPRGKVKKVVRFTRLRGNIFNLTFGDLIANSRKIDDVSVTNNADSQKVLATVAAVVLDFMLNYPNTFVIVKGSTHSRNRLYRMGITNNLKEINDKYEVFGFKNDKWEFFKTNEDYDSFLIRHR